MDKTNYVSYLNLISLKNTRIILFVGKKLTLALLGQAVSCFFKRVLEWVVCRERKKGRLLLRLNRFTIL